MRGASVRREPGGPVRPPASGMARRVLEPFTGARDKVRVRPVVPPDLRWRVDDACDMTRSAHYERHLAAQKPRGPVRRAPRHDVIFARGDDVRGDLDAPEIDR